MGDSEKARQNKQEDAQQKHRSRHEEPEPLFEQLQGWGPGEFSLAETPFFPRMDQHAELLARAAAHSDMALHNLVTQLQRAYGNRYVQRLLNSEAVQAKLTINAPGDVYEQEADEVAEAVTRNTKAAVKRQEEEELQMQPGEGEEEEEVQAQRQEEEEEEELQAQPDDGTVATVAGDIETRINSARGGGQPLAKEARQPIEQAFGADFSDVRVHTDSEANKLNHDLSAKAFTTGKDIFFRQGEYSPGSSSGQKLLAHELTHVVQQGKGVLLERRCDDLNEVEASHIERGLKSRVTSRTNVVVQRNEFDDKAGVKLLKKDTQGDLDNDTKLLRLVQNFHYLKFKYVSTSKPDGPILDTGSGEGDCGTLARAMKKVVLSMGIKAELQPLPAYKNCLLWDMTRSVDLSRVPTVNGGRGWVFEYHQAVLAEGKSYDPLFGRILEGNPIKMLGDPVPWGNKFKETYEDGTILYGPFDVAGYPGNYYEEEYLAKLGIKLKD
jgi:hypothetical protein